MSRACTSDDFWWTRILIDLMSFYITIQNYQKTWYQKAVPNNDVVDGAPISVSGQIRKRIHSSLLLFIEFSISLKSFHIVHYKPGGNGIEAAPDDVVRPDVTFVPRPAISAVISRPPSDTCVYSI
ncbi:hypothetical protein RhiirA4_487218 [Rhizophagus irregularis]|uniref:Uncharacterized protein n=1 Tax=Rhizophagus irregularis TaxID=588596 RepID=A0A2I1HSE0_9GLOM|nr:hypothetical protein RhiirA4_487218 [Rhizophagus irregularis]